MLSRRAFLATIGKGSLASIVPNAIAANAPTRLVYARQNAVAPPLPKLRLTVDYVLDPSPTVSNHDGPVLPANTVLPIIEQVTGTPYGENNNAVWFRTPNGFVHSAYVQLVDDRPNAPQPVADARAKFWAEITVPYVGLMTQPNRTAQVRFLGYYSSVYRVVDALQVGSEWWYRLDDGLRGGGFTPAYALRKFGPEELAPISANIHSANKRILVDLRTHIVTAFENNRAVYQAKCASGERVSNKFTPAGTYRVIQKSPTSHMIGAQGRLDAYSLPGVPFPTYFTASGIAFHGAYWHFDWGARRTHGCINMSSADARWIWRWSTPRANAATTRQFATRSAPGTLVQVVDG